MVFKRKSRLRRRARGGVAWSGQTGRIQRSAAAVNPLRSGLGRVCAGSGHGTATAVRGRAPPLRSGSGCARRRARYDRAQRRRAPGAPKHPRAFRVSLRARRGLAPPGAHPSRNGRRKPTASRAPSGLAKLAHLPQKTWGRLNFDRTSRRSPSPTQFVGEGRGGGARHGARTPRYDGTLKNIDPPPAVRGEGFRHSLLSARQLARGGAGGGAPGFRSETSPGTAPATGGAGAAAPSP